MHSLAERSALSDQNDVTDFDVEGRLDVSGEVSVSFLVSVVFGHIVEIIASDDDGSLHLGGNDDSF